MHPLANSHCKCQTDFYSVFLTSLCQNGRCSNRLISILYLYQKQHLLWTIQKNPCTLNSKESFMNPSASYSSTELPKKKKKLSLDIITCHPLFFFEASQWASTELPKIKKSLDIITCYSLFYSEASQWARILIMSPPQTMVQNLSIPFAAIQGKRKPVEKLN